MKPVPVVRWRLEQVGTADAPRWAAVIDGEVSGWVWVEGGRYWRGRLAGSSHGFHAGQSESAAMATFIGRWRRAAFEVGGQNAAPAH